MKLTKDSVLAKAVTGVVAIASGAMMLGLAAVPANAQSSAELQAQIEALLAQIAALQSQLNVGSGSTSGLYCNFTFTRDLAVGATGADVMNLQKFLNSVSGVQVAASGVGSAGMESSYFGTLTAQAVSAFQVKYSSEILAPLGLTSGTGYWGASSRAKARDLCAAAPAPGGDDGDDDVDSGDLQGGEGDITEYDILSNYNDEEVMQGQTEKVFGFEFDADGSDISVRRVDFIVEANADDPGTDDDAKAEPWDFIESVALYHGSDKVAEMDANSSSDWEKLSTADIDGESDDDTYRMRFSGLSERVDEDETSKWSVEFEARDVLDTGDIPQDFDMAIATDGIRAVDGAGINIYGGSSAASYRVAMKFDETTAGTLDVSASEDFDDDVVADLDDTTDTDDVVVGMFEVEADEQDITIEDLPVDLVHGDGDAVQNLVSSLSLYVGDELIESKSVTSSSGGSTTITFDDIDYEVEDGDTVTFTVKADFQELDGSGAQAEGDSVYTAVFGANIDAEDAEGDSVTPDGNWNITGDDSVYVYTKLPMLTLVSVSASEGAEDSSGDVDDATYQIKFEVKAVDGDIYIPNDAISTSTSASAGSSDEGVEVFITGSATASTSVGDSSATLTSTATNSGGYFKVNKGQTKTFTATVNYNNDGGTEAFYHAEFLALNWDTAAQTPTKVFTFGFENWETDSLFLDD